MESPLKVYNLFNNFKDLHFSMPGGWNDKYISIFLKSCRIHIDDLKKISNDDNTRWRKIALLGAKMSENATLFTINSCMEVAQCIKSYVSRNQSRMTNNDVFNEFYNDIEDLLAYFPHEHNVNRGLSLSSEKLSEVSSPSKYHIPREYDVAIEEALFDMINKNTNVVRDDKPHFWVDLSKTVNERFGVSCNVKEFLKNRKENVIAMVKKIENPLLRKNVFIDLTSKFSSVFDFVEPKNVRKSEFLNTGDKIQSVVNKLFMEEAPSNAISGVHLKNDNFSDCMEVHNEKHKEAYKRPKGGTPKKRKSPSNVPDVMVSKAKKCFHVDETPNVKEEVELKPQEVAGSTPNSNNKEKETSQPPGPIPNIDVGDESRNFIENTQTTKEKGTGSEGLSTTEDNVSDVPCSETSSFNDSFDKTSSQNNLPLNDSNSTVLPLEFKPCDELEINNNPNESIISNDQVNEIPIKNSDVFDVTCPSSENLPSQTPVEHEGKKINLSITNKNQFISEGLDGKNQSKNSKTSVLLDSDKTQNYNINKGESDSISKKQSLNACEHTISVSTVVAEVNMSVKNSLHGQQPDGNLCIPEISIEQKVDSADKEIKTYSKLDNQPKKNKFENNISNELQGSGSLTEKNKKDLVAPHNPAKGQKKGSRLKTKSHPTPGMVKKSISEISQKTLRKEMKLHMTELDGSLGVLPGKELSWSKNAKKFITDLSNSGISEEVGISADELNVVENSATNGPHNQETKDSKKKMKTQSSSENENQPVLTTPGKPPEVANEIEVKPEAVLSVIRQADKKKSVGRPRKKKRALPALKFSRETEGSDEVHELETDAKAHTDDPQKGSSELGSKKTDMADDNLAASVFSHEINIFVGQLLGHINVEEGTSSSLCPESVSQEGEGAADSKSKYKPNHDENITEISHGGQSVDDVKINLSSSNKCKSQQQSRQPKKKEDKCKKEEPYCDVLNPSAPVIPIKYEGMGENGLKRKEPILSSDEPLINETQRLRPRVNDTSLPPKENFPSSVAGNQVRTEQTKFSNSDDPPSGEQQTEKSPSTYKHRIGKRKSAKKNNVEPDAEVCNTNDNLFSALEVSATDSPVIDKTLVNNIKKSGVSVNQDASSSSGRKEDNLNNPRKNKTEVTHQTLEVSGSPQKKKANLPQKSFAERVVFNSNKLLTGPKGKVTKIKKTGNKAQFGLKPQDSNDPRLPHLQKDKSNASKPKKGRGTGTLSLGPAYRKGICDSNQSLPSCKDTNDVRVTRSRSLNSDDVPPKKDRRSSDSAITPLVETQDPEGVDNQKGCEAKGGESHAFSGQVKNKNLNDSSSLQKSRSRVIKQKTKSRFYTTLAVESQNLNNPCSANEGIPQDSNRKTSGSLERKTETISRESNKTLSKVENKSAKVKSKNIRLSFKESDLLLSSSNFLQVNSSTDVKTKNLGQSLIQSDLIKLQKKSQDSISPRKGKIVVIKRNRCKSLEGELNSREKFNNILEVGCLEVKRKRGRSSSGLEVKKQDSNSSLEGKTYLVKFERMESESKTMADQENTLDSNDNLHVQKDKIGATKRKRGRPRKQQPNVMNLNPQDISHVRTIDTDVRNSSPVKYERVRGCVNEIKLLTGSHILENEPNPTELQPSETMNEDYFSQTRPSRRAKTSVGSYSDVKRRLKKKSIDPKISNMNTFEEPQKDLESHEESKFSKTSAFEIPCKDDIESQKALKLSVIVEDIMLSNTLVDKYNLHSLLKELVESGRLCKKNKIGKRKSKKSLLKNNKTLEQETVSKGTADLCLSEKKLHFTTEKAKKGHGPFKSGQNIASLTRGHENTVKSEADISISFEEDINSTAANTNEFVGSSGYRNNLRSMQSEQRCVSPSTSGTSQNIRDTTCSSEDSVSVSSMRKNVTPSSLVPKNILPSTSSYDPDDELSNHASELASIDLPWVDSTIDLPWVHSDEFNEICKSLRGRFPGSYEDPGDYILNDYQKQRLVNLVTTSFELDHSLTQGIDQTDPNWLRSYLKDFFTWQKMEIEEMKAQMKEKLDKEMEFVNQLLSVLSDANESNNLGIQHQNDGAGSSKS